MRCHIFLGLRREQRHLINLNIGMRHHIFRNSLDGISNDTQGLSAIQCITTLHADVIIAFAEVDDTRHIVIDFALRHLHSSTVVAAQIGILLHGISLKAKRDFRLDAQVTAEVVKGIDTIAYSRHEFAAEATNEVQHILLRHNISKDRHTLDKHTIGTG